MGGVDGGISRHYGRRCLETLHVRFLRYSAFYTPLLLTLAPERLAAEGLKATFDRSTPDRTIEAGLQDGTVQVAQSAPAVNFEPSIRGAAPDVRHFALLNSRDGFFLAARDVDAPFSWAVLEGRSVVVDHFFQPLAMFRAALRDRGVDARKVKLIDAGEPAGIEAAFRAGQGDFVHMQGPTPQLMEREGLGRVVASVGATVGPVAFSSLCARPAWLATGEARAFMRVFRRARLDAVEAPAAELARQIASFLPNVPLEVLGRTIAMYQSIDAWRGDVTITPELYERTVDIFVETGHILRRPPMHDVVMAPPPV